MNQSKGIEKGQDTQNPYVKPVDKNLGKSPAFKSVTRSELDKIKGTRPLYEQHFQNDFNRYNVKYLDPKVKGRVKFDHPHAQAREAKPFDLNHRSLIKLAQIALNVRKGPQVEHKVPGKSLNKQMSSLSNGRSSISPRRVNRDSTL